MSLTANQLIDEARLSVPEISAAETHERLQQQDPAILVDVRELSEWEKGHVSGAIHAPRGLLEWLADPSYVNHQPRLAGRTDAHIVVMCASGGRSLLAAKTLREMGYSSVSSMTGGINAWTESGLPIESDPH